MVASLTHARSAVASTLPVFQCPAYDHTRRDTWPGDTFTTDLRRLWSYLERIGAVTPPPTGNEREREHPTFTRYLDVEANDDY